MREPIECSSRANRLRTVFTETSSRRAASRRLPASFTATKYCKSDQWVEAGRATGEPLIAFND